MKHVVFALTFLLAGCNSAEKTPVPVATTIAAPAASSTSSPAASAEADQLTLVTTPSQVCMVNDQFMGREQIPVEVEGKTYFGCCEMCKGRLGGDPSVRSAKDPVSGKLIDKASAIIAKRPSGEVLYFENTNNFRSYRAL